MTAVPRRIAALAASTVVAVALLAPGAPATASPPVHSVTAATAVTAGADRDESTAALRAAMQDVVDAGATGVNALLDNGDDVTRLAVGRARIDPERPLRTNDQARAGSITKTLIAVITLQLMREDRLALDDTVERWLPGLVPGGSEDHPSHAPQPHERHLQLHRRPGLPRQGHRRSLPPLEPARAHRRRTREPTAVPARDELVLQQHWLHPSRPGDPEGLRTVGSRPRAATGDPAAAPGEHLPHEQRTFPGSYAHGYAPPGMFGDGYTDTSRWTPTWAWAAGALVSTTTDLATFYQALLSGRLLPHSCSAR